MKIYILITIFSALFLSVKVQAQSDFYNPSAIRVLKLYFSQPNWDHLLDSLFSLGQDDRLMASINIDGTHLDSVGVRYKGYSSVDTTRVKNPLNIDLDFLKADQDYYGIIKLKLSNVIHDPSFIREVLSYEIARKYMPASKANFAYVYVNDTLLGLYTNVEAVDKRFAETHFGSRDNCYIKGSPNPLIYPLGSNSNLQYYTPDTACYDTTCYLPYYDVESDYGWTDLVNLIDTLNNNTGNIEKILNVDRTLWMLAFDYSLVNLDSYIGYAQNYYMYMDDHKIFNPVLWDLNMSFGSFRLSDGGTSAYSGGITIAKAKILNPLGLLTFSVSPRPLIKKILVDPMWKKMYLAHMRTIIYENFVSGEYYTRGQQLQATIDSCVQNDYNKFYSYSDFTNNIDTTVSAMIDYPGIKDLMEARIDYLNTFSGFLGQPVISDVTNTPVGSSFEIWITAKVSNADTCFLAYRYITNDLFTKISMFDDGNHQDGVAGDSIFGASIPTGNSVQFYLYAQNVTAGMFSPERAEYEYHLIQNTNPSDIVINEIMAINKTFIPDQNNGYDDWIEIYNNSSGSVNMLGKYLSDNVSNLNKWAFPDTSISAHSYLIIWADNETTQHGLHSNFKLSGSGEAVYLSYSGNNVIDGVTFQQQKQDTTYGRYPNGTGTFNFMRPSFSAINWPHVSVNMVPFNNSSISVFPNPSDNVINVIFKNGKEKKYLIEIVNTNGMLVYKENIESNFNGSLQKSIDVSQLQSGMYILRVVSESSAYNTKLMIY
ncbi:MAG: hypothetical protein A2X08_11980 [Bacteroidetes bacterium GWA2_32_17]|nr:MAG: hypothetical protein A2X08_11980 [Bacteroidetes bacterium GWA2_32_17]